MEFGKEINDFGDHKATSVGDLLAIMKSNLYSSKARWIYRGQADVSWDVIPSLGRLYKSKNFKTLEKLYNFEKAAFSEFYVRNFSTFREHDKISNLAIAQHHGLKTRLLDWTFSPLFALFFAVENESNYETDGVVYAYENTLAYNNYCKKNFNPMDEKTYVEDYYFIWAPSHTSRIKAQQGVFQLFKKPHQEFERPFNFHRITIPKSNKSDIKRELYRLGVSYDSVFPEIDGIASTINYYKLKSGD